MGLVIPLAGPASAQTDPADSLPTTNAPASPEEISSEIAAKEAEIAKLKAQLNQANSQIKKLNDQNSALQQSDAKIKEQGEAAGIIPSPPPTTLITATPDTSTPIASHDLLWYVRNSADTTSQYLKDKKLVVRGKLVGFENPMVLRVFGLELDSGDPNSRVVCRFVIPEVYVAVYLKHDTGEVVGQTAGGGIEVLMHRGDTITVEGKCNAETSGDLTISNCRLIL